MISIRRNHVLDSYALSRRRPVTADNVNELPAPAAVSTVAKQAA
jgi:hypothetical protein